MMQDILLVLVGVLVGAMNAIAGGGMLIGFPVLLALGLPPLSANATSNITVLPGSLSSAFGYRKYLRKIAPHHLLMLIPCGIGAVIGAFILRNTSFSSFERIVPGLVLFAVVLFAFQPVLHFQIRQHLHAHPKYYSLQRFAATCLALLPIGIYGGYFGAGFGFIMLAFLGYTSLHDVHQMNGLKNLAGATISLATIICLLGSHLINWRMGLLMAAGNFAGGYLGAVGAQRVSTHTIRIIVISIGLATAAYLGLRSY